MKNLTAIFWCLILVLPVIAFPSCAGGFPSSSRENEPASIDSGTAFKDVEGKEWLLSEIRSSGKTIIIDRNKFEANNMGGYFTINFQDGSVNGTGAPNRYFGPYSLGSNRALSIGDLASTLMAAFIVPEEIKEGEYFALLPKVSRWELQAAKLLLYCEDSDGLEVVLVYI